MEKEWPETSIIQTGNLGQQQKFEFDRVFEAGDMAGVIAVCDSNCVNLDVQVLDSDGFRVAYDQQGSGIDRRPFASFPVETTGTYRVEIGMAECRREPCAFAYMIVGREGSN